MPEECKRVVACSLLAKAIIDLYTGKEPGPPETAGFGFDPVSYLIASEVTVPFTVFKYLNGSGTSRVKVRVSSL